MLCRADPIYKMQRVHPVSASEEVLFSNRDSKCMNKHLPSDANRTPELLVGNAERTGVPPEAIDSTGTCEMNVCRGECREFGRKLLQLSAHTLARGVLCVERGRYWLRQQGCKEMVDVLGVEKGRNLREDLSERVETVEGSRFVSTTHSLSCNGCVSAQDRRDGSLHEVLAYTSMHVVVDADRIMLVLMSAS